MASVMPNPKQQYFDLTGNPLIGGKLYTYAAGTSTPKATYSNAAGTTPNANPVVLDSRGEATIFWDGAYKIELKDANGNLVYTLDNFESASSALSSQFGVSSGSGLIGWIQAGVSAVARWVQDKLRESVSVKDFGAVGDGVTDDTAAFQSAITYVSGKGGGTVRFYDKHLIDTSLTVSDNVRLIGDLGRPGEQLPAASADYDALGSLLIVNSAKTITLKDSASVQGAIVMRKGLNLPFADAAAATAGVEAFSGTAFTVGGADACFRDLLVLGFTRAIDCASFERTTCERVYGDCTNGIRLATVYDIARLTDCHFWPWTTTHQTWTTDTLLTRTGVAYEFNSVGDWSKITNCFSYGYSVGTMVNSCDHVQIIGGGADYAGGLASTSVGAQIKGTSKDALLLGFQAAAQGTGIEINTTATSGAVARIIGADLWDNDIQHIIVNAGRAIVSSSTMRGGPVGLVAVAGSSGVCAIGNDFESVTTPYDVTGAALDKSTIYGNRFVSCTDSSIGQRQSFDNQAQTAVYSAFNTSGIGYTTTGRAARGTASTPTISQDSDTPLRLFGQVYDGSAFQTLGGLRCQAHGVPALGATPGQWLFSTTPSGSVSAVDRVAINRDGNLLPVTDNASACGGNGNRWTSVWAANGTIQTSDAREKTDVQSSSLGLGFINTLRPVSYRWISGGKSVVRQVYRDADGNEVNQDAEGAIPAEIITQDKPGVRTHWGLIAQEVKAACDSAGVDFGGWVLSDASDPNSQQALRMDQFIAPLIKAVQELSAEVQALKNRP